MIPQILPKKVRLDPQGNVNFFHARFVWNMSTFFLKVKVLNDLLEQFPQIPVDDSFGLIRYQELSHHARYK